GTIARPARTTVPDRARPHRGRVEPRRARRSGGPGSSDPPTGPLRHAPAASAGRTPGHAALPADRGDWTISTVAGWPRSARRLGRPAHDPDRAQPERRLADRDASPPRRCLGAAHPDRVARRRAAGLSLADPSGLIRLS